MLLVGLSSYRFKVFLRPNVHEDFFEFFSIEFAACLNHLAGPPGAERGPGPCSDMTDFRSREVQNALEKIPQFGPKYDVISKKNKKTSDLQKEKVFELHMLIFQCHFDGPPLKPMGPLLGSLKSTKPP